MATWTSGAATGCYRPGSARADGCIRSTGRISSRHNGGSSAQGTHRRRSPSTRRSSPGSPIPSAQTFVSNLRQLGIVVEPNYFDGATFAKKLYTPGEPWDVALAGVGASYPDPAGALIPLLRGTRYEAQFNAANRVTGAARAKAWAELETDLMTNDPPVAAYGDFTPLGLVSQNFGCWSEFDFDLAAVCKK